MSFNPNEWQKQKEAFYAAHPDCPRTKDIPVLNLIMKKEHALAILRGEKKVEFRAFSEHYNDRLNDRYVLDYINAHEDDNEVQEAYKDLILDPLRNVLTLHFHNYNNSWFLDVKCICNDMIALVSEDVEALRSQFGCTELDDVLADFEKRGEVNRPIYFYFAVGDVIATNLEA